jgi:ribosomal RNA-processing protein 8
MRKKLDGARFRWINEQLYTTDSREAVRLVSEDPALFDVVCPAPPRPAPPAVLHALTHHPPAAVPQGLPVASRGVARQPR